MRINTTAFCESVGQDLKLLENTSLSEKWQFPRFRGKGLPLPWIQQIIRLQKDSGNKCPCAPVTCISQIPLEKWNSMSSAEIRNVLPPKPGPLKRFRAAKKRLIRFKDTLERFKQNQLLENDVRTHIIEPKWASTEACACCGKLLNFSVEPRNLIRRCNSTQDFNVQMLDSWSLQYDSMICCIDKIIATLS